MSKTIKAGLILSNAINLEQDFIDFNSQENIELKILQAGQGREIFLEKALAMLLKNPERKNFTEEDIKGLEEELDLVIKISQNKSLENALVTGLNYAEIIFIEKDEVDFCFTDYQNAIKEFKTRKRNFGA
jgi:undecaprenyl pyrophosphate synthase